MTAIISSPTSIEPTFVRHRFSVKRYEDLIVGGYLTEDDRVELIRGEIIEKMPTGLFHAAVVRLLIRLLAEPLRCRTCYLSQSSLRLADSMPEPDFALLKSRADDYSFPPGPTAHDVLLLAEVSESTLANDQNSKLKLYAENSIPEYWIVNLIDRQLEVYRQPGPTGYAEVRVLRDADTVSPLAFSELTLAVRELFPPAVNSIN
jgi:Uma2 family endonuclease